MSVRKSGENYRQIYGKSKTASGEIQAQVRPQTFFTTDPLLCSFSLQLTFFSEQPFYGNYLTLDSHTNTVISHTFAYSSRWRRKLWQGLFLSALQKVRGNLELFNACLKSFKTSSRWISAVNIKWLYNHKTVINRTKISSLIVNVIISQFWILQPTSTAV